MKKTSTINNLLLSIPIILLAIPWTAYKINGYSGFTGLILLAIIITIGTRKTNKILSLIYNNIKNNILGYACIIIYTGYVTIATLLNRNNQESIVLIANQLMIIFSMFYNAIENDKSYKYIDIKYYITIGMGIQCSILLPQIYNNPTLLRSVVNEPTWDMGNQATFGVMAVLMPAIITLLIKYNKVPKLILAASIISIITCITLSTFAAPIGFLIINIILYNIIKSTESLNKAVQGIFKGLIIILTLYIIYVTINNNDYFESISYRFNNFIEDPTSGGYDGADAVEGSRYVLMQKSWDAFSENILFGTFEGNIRTNESLGRHSSAVDVLGGYGIIGGLPLWIFNIIISKNLFTEYLRNKNSTNLLTLVATLTYIIGGIFNPVWEGIYPWLVIIFTNPFKSAKESIINIRKLQ